MNFFSDNFLANHESIYNSLINIQPQDKENFFNIIINPKNLINNFNNLKNPENMPPISLKKESNISQMNNYFSELLSFFSKYNNNNNNINNINSINDSNQKEDLLKIKRKRNKKSNKRAGRIKRSDSKKVGKHDRNTKDNMMRKIKNKIILSANNLLNYLLDKEKNEKYKELKIDKIYKIKGIYSQELHRKYNIWLILQKLKTIFCFQISPLYKFGDEDENLNKTIIDYIYKTGENEFVKTKKLLEMPFYEFIHKIFLNEDETLLKDFNLNEKRDEFKFRFDDFIDDIKNNISGNTNKKRKKNEDNIDNYIGKMKNLARNYEKYFYEKSGRSTNNSKKTKNNDKLINNIIQGNDEDYKEWEREVSEIIKKIN